jgi:CO/xanthine dehydrogenase FAD-binding subunit
VHNSTRDVRNRNPGNPKTFMDLNTVSEITRPRSRQDLKAWRPGDAFLAGGTWLFSEPQPRLNRLIDLTAFEWPPMVLTEEELRISATCTLAQLDGFSLPKDWRAAPLVNQCCRSLYGSFKIWNAATVGGNICMALPAGPMISLSAALDGVCTIWTLDGLERHLAVTDVVVGPQQNALQSGEILHSIAMPTEALMRRTAFRQISLTPQGRSAALVIGTLSRSGSFALTVTASTRRPIKLSFPNVPADLELRRRIEAEIPSSMYYDDVHGAPAWRRHMTLTFADEIRRELSEPQA